MNTISRMWGAICVLFLLGAAGASFADIALDAVSTGENATTGVSSITFSHTIGGGSNRMLIVAAGREGNDTNPNVTISSVTYNSVAMTLVSGTSAQVGTTFTANTSLYYMLGSALPPAGTYNVVITLTGNAGDILGIAVSLTGVAQQAPEASAANTSSTGTPITTNITTLTNGAWLVDAVMSGAGDDGTPPVTPAEFQTTVAGMVKQTVIVGLSSSMATATRPVAAAGGASMGWQKTGTTNRLAHSVAALAPTGADVDSDHDGLLDSDEVARGTDPHNPDTDGDGVTDGTEVTFGTNPLDPTSIPALPTMTHKGVIGLAALLVVAGLIVVLKKRVFVRHAA